MRRLFDEELADLDSSFTEMGMLVSQTIQKAVQSSDLLLLPRHTT